MIRIGTPALPHPAANRLVQSTFLIGFAMRKVLSILCHAKRALKIVANLGYFFPCDREHRSKSHVARGRYCQIGDCLSRDRQLFARIGRKRGVYPLIGGHGVLR